MPNKKYGKGVIAIFPKSNSVDIVIKTEKAGKYAGLNVREFVTSNNYTGYTKKGVLIPLEQVKEFKKSIVEAVKKLG